MITGDHQIVGERHLAGVHHGHVAARAADFHGDEVVVACLSGYEIEGAYAGGRPGEQQADRPLAHLGDGCRTAVALDQVERPAESAFVQGPVQTQEVGNHLRCQGSVDDRR